MALLFMDGFDAYEDKSSWEHDERWGVSSVNFTPTTGRINGKAVYSTGAYEASAMLSADSSATIFVGFAMKILTSPTASRDVLDLYDTDGNLEGRLVINADRTFSYEVGGITVVATSSAGISTGEWHAIGLEVYMHASAGTVKMWIDGVQVANGSALDTLDGTAASIRQFLIRTTSGHTTYWDDLFIGDDSGSDLTAYPGDCHIEMLTPNANGTTNNFTASPAVSNYLNVDDGNPKDDDTTYNYSATATDKELYGFSAITGSLDAVYAVQVQAAVRKEGAGSRTVNLIARSSATESDSAQKGMAVDDYLWVTHHYENDPNGGGNWTQSAVNAAEFGLEIGA